jgi:hypothetical protein
VLGQVCGAGTGQRWRRTPVTDSSFQFRNTATGKCLTAQVTVATCTTTTARWNRLR